MRSLRVVLAAVLLVCAAAVIIPQFAPTPALADSGVELLQTADPNDSDGDGTPNGVDNCPNDGGPAQNAGCPVSATTVPGQPTSAPVQAAALPQTGACVVAPAGGNVNIRALPSTSAAIAGSLSASAPANVVASVSIGGDVWRFIGTGWVAASVTRTGGDCSTLATLELPAGSTLEALTDAPTAERVEGVADDDAFAAAFESLLTVNLEIAGEAVTLTLLPYSQYIFGGAEFSLDDAESPLFVEIGEDGTLVIGDAQFAPPDESTSGAFQTAVTEDGRLLVAWQNAEPAACSADSAGTWLNGAVLPADEAAEAPIYDVAEGSTLTIWLYPLAEDAVISAALLDEAGEAADDPAESVVFVQRGEAFGALITLTAPADGAYTLAFDGAANPVIASIACD